MKIAAYQIESFINNIAQNKQICGTLLYGPESSLITIYGKKIASNIVSNPNDPFLVTNLSEKKINEDSGILDDEFFAIPMLGGRKLINISDAGNKTAEALKAIFETNPKLDNSNFILIYAADLDKNSSLRKFAETSPSIAVLACYEDNEATITGIIQQKLKEHNLIIEQGVMELMLESYGKNRLIILSEIEKLALFVGDNRNISFKIAEQLITNNQQASINEFVNCFANLELINGLNYANKLFKEKFNSVGLCRILANYFTKLRSAKINIENGIALEAEVKNQRLFFKQEPIFKKHLQKWSINKLNDLVLKLQELEVRCKSGNFNQELILKSFINYSYLKYKK